jgi:bifunctional oligoribonuclease and PAP phosphatase NrnA
LSYKENLAKIFETVNGSDDFLLVSHVYPDGDSIGSITAFYKLLCNIGKNVSMYINSEIPYQYSYIPNLEKIKKEFIPKDHNDLVVVFLDCAEMDRARFDIDPLKGKIKAVINIDHHINNPAFGDINLIDHKKSAVSEMLFDFIHKYYEIYMDIDIAISLYTGMLTDTGKFQYSNTTREVHSKVGYLLDFNINPSRIFSNIYECEPRNRFKLLEIALRRIKIIDSRSLIYSYVLKRDFIKLDLPYSASDGIIEILRSAKDIDIVAFYKQVEKKYFKVSLRSTNNGVDVSKIAQAFGGGGHVKAAAYSCKGGLKKNMADLIKEIGRHY